MCRDFGGRLRRLREERDIAAAISVATGTVHAWERGRSIPGLHLLAAIATALGCSIVDLLPERAHYHGAA